MKEKCNKQKNLKQGFTLLEMLVVVLIIGILAGIALPQYKEAVEKSIMQEAIMNLRTIANANERFYLLHNRYATKHEMDKLDIEIPGEIKDYSQTGVVGNRVVTKYFIYSPHQGIEIKAIAHRVKDGCTDYQTNGSYYIYIKIDNTMACAPVYGGQINSVQTKLCNKILKDGHL